MNKDNYSTIIDFGSSKLRLGVFDENLSKIYFKSKDIDKESNFNEYSKLINFLIRDAESKISNHLKNIVVLYDASDVYSIDLSIKKILDQKTSFKNICSTIILEAEKLIYDNYINNKIIHTVVKKYIINGKEFLNIPTKITEIKSLIIEIKFLCIPNDQYNNIIDVFKKNNLKILNFFSSSLVRSFKYLDHFVEKKSVAFLDIGLERSSLFTFVNQKLDFFSSIPIGGQHVSKDISQIIKLSFDDAENLKRTFNKSEVEFSYDETKKDDNKNIIKKILGRNISIDLLKKVILSRIEEIINLSFKNNIIYENNDKQEDLTLILIGNGSKLLDKNSFQLEDKYKFEEINFYEENDLEICKAGILFEEKSKQEFPQKVVKNQKKMGVFQKFFNLFGNN